MLAQKQPHTIWKWWAWLCWIRLYSQKQAVVPQTLVVQCLMENMRLPRAPAGGRRTREWHVGFHCLSPGKADVTKAHSLSGKTNHTVPPNCKKMGNVYIVWKINKWTGIEKKRKKEKGKCGRINGVFRIITCSALLPDLPHNSLCDCVLN